jgi:hypothetical protein
LRSARKSDLFFDAGWNHERGFMLIEFHLESVDIDGH